MSSENSTYVFSSVRTIESDGETWYCLTDVATALGCDKNDADLMGAFLDAPEVCRSVRMLYGPDGTEESVPVVSLAGLAALLLASPPVRFAEFAHTVLVAGLPQFLRPQWEAARTAARPVTPWGDQPMRAVMKSRGISVADTAKLMSTVPGRSPLRVTGSTLNAVVFGRQLPLPEFLARARYVFQQPVEELFTAAVLEASSRKYQVTALQPESSPSVQAPVASYAELPVAVPPSSPLPFVEPTPVPESVPEPDSSSPLVVGVSSESSEAGFLDMSEFSAGLPLLEGELSQEEQDAVFAEAFGTPLFGDADSGSGV
jgi:hypothetical protein